MTQKSGDLIEYTRPDEGKISVAFGILWREGLRVASAIAIIIAGFFWIVEPRAITWIDAQIKTYNYATKEEFLTVANALKEHLEEVKDISKTRDAQIDAITNLINDVNNNLTGLTEQVKGLTNAQSTTQSDVREIRQFILKNQ